MKNKFQNIILISFIPVLFSIPLKAQTELLVNPSLDGIEYDGDDMVFKPYNWETCMDNPSNDNDVYNDPNFSICRSSMGLELCNIDGKNFCLLRTRSDNYGSLGDSDRRGKYEHISSKLVNPLVESNVYNLTIWLVSILKYGVGDAVEPDTAYPLRFQVYGADTYCTANENDILVDSLITNTDWIEYSFNLSPKRRYEYIYFRVYWDNKIWQEKGWRYNGMMYLDKSSLTVKCETKYLSLDTLIYTQDPPLQLNAPFGYLYEWGPENYLSDPMAQSPHMTEYCDSVHVTSIDANSCRTEKNFTILFSCDALYPVKEIDTVNVFYKTYQDIYLHASTGKSWVWDNTKPLSAYNIQNPVLTGYDSIINVTITDKYGCDFNEVFKILLDCDILYQSRNFNHQTQFVNYGDMLTLEPDFSGNNYAWSPTHMINCSDCNRIGVIVYNNISYTVSYYDDFDCKLTETFPIEIKLEIPNVITPGIAGEGDGKNDVFVIPGLPEGSSIQIFDKTGLLVFKTESYNKNNWWNGTDRNGKPVHSGTYWYALGIPGNEKPMTGFIFVIR